MKKNTRIIIVLVIIILTVLSVIYVNEQYNVKNKAQKKKIKEDIQIETKLSKIKVGMFYKDGSENWKSTLSQLEQTMVSNLESLPVDVEKQDYKKQKYDIIYLDGSLAEIEDKDNMKKFIEEFVKLGGGVFVENSLYDFFDKDFFGVEEFHKINSYPKKLDFPKVNSNLEELQGTIKDFDYIYRDYMDFNKLSKKEYGYGATLKGGKSLAKSGEISLFTMNKFGTGYVFLTNPILPNRFHIDNYSMNSEDLTKKYFVNTSSAMNQLIKDKFISYISKEKDGFSLEKTFGAYGRPSMAWQLHYEEIEGIKQNSGEIFENIAKKNLQIPSYTIVRNSYKWFSRYETITYLLGEENKKGKYKMDEYENSYSSGKHIASNNRWLEIEKKENAGSYFEDLPEHDYRAYPFIKDLNNDGKVDIISGSSNGKFYYFKGKGMGENYETSSKKEIKDLQNKSLKVKGYSSPYLYDINKDGTDDIVTGGSDGKIYWFSGAGDLKFKEEGILIDTKTNKQVVVTIGKLNDKEDKIIVGGNNKKIKVYDFDYESNNVIVNEEDLKIEGLNEINGNWISPYIYDIDSDGNNEIIFGTFDGYIGVFRKNENILKFEYYLEGDEKNYKENTRLKFGNYSVPFLTDINNDNIEDLIVGSFEYGLAYPIDSKYFPYRDALQTQINKMLEKDYSIGTHFYTNIGASDLHEKKELDMHNKALESYGIDKKTISGFNQHTWHTSKEGLVQSLKNGYDADKFWISGFKPSRSDATPQVSAENAITIPFYMKEKENVGDNLLVFNTSTFLYDENSWGNIVSKYGLPMSLYYHCDLIYLEDEKEKITKDIEQLNEFRTNNSYNFVTEDQYAKMVSMSKNVNIYPKKENNEIKFDVEVLNKKIPLYDEKYLEAIGVKMILGEKLQDKNINIDSKIWKKEGNVIYLGVDRLTKIGNVKKEKEEIRILRSNLPVELVGKNKKKKIFEFKEGGMMEIEVEGEAYTKTKGWEVTKLRNKNSTIFTKFGEPSKIEIRK